MQHIIAWVMLFFVFLGKCMIWMNWKKSYYTFWMILNSNSQLRNMLKMFWALYKSESDSYFSLPPLQSSYHNYLLLYNYSGDFSLFLNDEEVSAFSLLECACFDLAKVSYKLRRSTTQKIVYKTFLFSRMVWRKYTYCACVSNHNWMLYSGFFAW